MPPDLSLIELVRAASRDLVRELGFMNVSLAGTDLPPSAVHALIEIDARPGITAGELAELLRLEKSSVSRLLRRLVASGDVAEHSPAAGGDGRTKPLALTPAGRERTAGIHAFARTRVAGALDRLEPEGRRAVAEGLALYAQALGAPAEPVRIVFGYRPGLAARVTEMHALYYFRGWGFGRRFESVVASGLAEFCDRLDHSANQIWAAVQNGRVVGSVAVDGEDLGEGRAHLRWFMVDDGLRGGGVGRLLLRTALDFIDGAGFAETALWTFAGLDAARHLYEANGFILAEERNGDQWGGEVTEQKFVRLHPRPTVLY